MREGVEELERRRRVREVLLGDRTRRRLGRDEEGEEPLRLGDELLERDADARPDVLVAREGPRRRRDDDGALERGERVEDGRQGRRREEGRDGRRELRVGRKEAREDAEERRLVERSCERKVGSARARPKETMSK